MPPEALAPSAGIVLSLFERVERRVRLLEVMRATRTGAIVLGAMALAGLAVGWRGPLAWVPATTVAAVLGGTLVWWSRPRWSTPAVGTLIERAIPDSRNVVFTARELASDPRDVAPWMRQRVFDAGGALASRADPASIVPFARDAALMSLVLAMVAAIAAGAPQRFGRAARAAADRLSETPHGATAPLLTIHAEIEPPRYTGAPTTTVTDPQRLEVVQGSQVALSLGGSGEWHVRFGTHALSMGDPSSRRVELVVRESGYFAVERGGDDRRLIPVAVIPDRAPTVRVEAPGKDMLLPNAQGHVPVSTTATDDFGLRSLDLVYTRVSGSGEQFEFTDGQLPLSLSRENGKAWKGAGTFDLSRLKLEPGDSLVYHAVARDGRPGDSGAATSDTFFIEIAGPGQVALPGFELPPDRERYALSQQMIVLKLQRLRAREASLTREVVEQELGGIAAEQRAVRANFIFLMGGHVENEEEEAEQSGEIQEGRLQNNARREINTAIKFMGDAEQKMVAVDTSGALPPAKSAVDALERAFGRNRYFLRTLAERSRIDPSRRLSGDLKEAKDWRRLLQAPSGDQAIGQARTLVSTLVSAASARSIASSMSAQDAGALAERALSVDPASADWQAVSSALSQLRDGIVAGRADVDLRRVVTAALQPLLKLAGSNVRGAAPDDLSGSLRGAWADEARRR